MTDLTATAGTTELSQAMIGLSESEKGKLNQYKLAIRDIVGEAEATLNRARVNVGHELLNARAIIKSDKNFGIWARWNTPFDSSSVWNPLMHIAQAELDGILTDEMLKNSNPAVLAKVIRLPDETRDDLLSQIEAGEKVKRADVPTVAEAKQREAASGDPAEVTGEEGQSKAEREEPVKEKPKQKNALDVVEEKRADWQELIDSPFAERFLMIKDLVGVAEQIELALALLGLDNDPQVLPNAQTLSFIEAALLEHECDGKGEEMQVKSAVRVINEARDSW